VPIPPGTAAPTASPAARRVEAVHDAEAIFWTARSCVQLVPVAIFWTPVFFPFEKKPWAQVVFPRYCRYSYCYL
jgi:hypothetical protein